MTLPSTAPGPAADLDLVAPWMSCQRWFANKGARPRLEEIGRWELDGEPGTRFVTHLLLDHAAGGATLYQVPLSYRDEPLADASPIGRHNLAWVYDAPHDPGFVRALLRMLATESGASGAGASATGERNPSSVAFDPDSPVLRTRVLSGEQSNTSIVIEWPDDEAVPVICKLFRALHHGQNPDVELQGALAAAGSMAVPRAVGAVVGEWPDSGRGDGRARGDLAFAQEFLPGAVDAWRLALESAADGGDFSEPARRLGVTTATVHAMLAKALPTQAATPSDITHTIKEMKRRLDAALREVPELEVHRPALEETLALASSAAWPAQQRIHGDLHLGQVLDVEGRGWFVVDFEGEPLRPMTERARLDNPLRDVAGMLRSFDYVAGALGVTAQVDGREWARAARLAFAEGYCEVSGLHLEDYRVVLDVFEADKALYEAVYEVRNRPEWLAIPVAAIERISTRVPG